MQLPFYLLLAPAVLIALVVLIYPLWDGIRASTQFYRYAGCCAKAGLGNYIQLWSDPEFLNSLWVTVSFVTLAVAMRGQEPPAASRCSCAREFRGIRLPPHHPHHSDGHLRRLLSPLRLSPDLRQRRRHAHRFFGSAGGAGADSAGQSGPAFLALVALDVWEWTPLMFLIILAGLQSLPVEPFEAARVDGAGAWRTFVDHTLPMLRPVLAIAIVLRTIDAFGTFDQVFVLTGGGPGQSTLLLSIFGYTAAFKFLQTGYAAALFVTMGVLILALALGAVRLLRRVDAT